MLEIKDARASYGAVEVLHGVSLSVAPGEVVALAGQNGSGKSTLARLACAMDVASPGMVLVDGEDPACGEVGRRAVRRLVGFVQQDPVDQIVSTVVFDEVAFGPRNLGLAEDEVRARVEEALAQAGLAGATERGAGSLSGGELQRLALAGVLAMHPRYLVLDEVTSMLDSGLRPGLRALFARLAHESGVGILSITHDPAELAAADRVVVLEEGSMAWEGAPVELVREHPDLWWGLVGSAPLARSMAARLGGDPAGARAAADTAGGASGFGAPVPSPGGSLVLRDVSYTYPGAVAPALCAVSLEAHAGEVLLLAGASGSGKSTLACIAAGLVAPDAGTVLLSGAPVAPACVGLAFQRPEAQLFLDTVSDELAFGPRNLGCTEDEVARRAEAAAERVGLDRALFERYPFELSGGQQRRVGLAGVLALEAGAYVLDEPTAGLDAAGRSALHRTVREMAAAGASVIVISHDLDEWLEVADRAVLLRAGAVAWTGAVGELRQLPEVWRAVGMEPPSSAAGGPAAEGGAAKVAAAAGHAAVPVPGRRIASRLASLDARVKIILLLALTVTVFAAPSPAVILLGFLLLAWCLPRAGVDAHALGRALKPVAVILAFTLLANLVACDGHAEVILAGPVGLDIQGGLRGLAAVLRIVMLLGFSLVVAFSTTPPEVCSACVRLLRPLGRLGVPVGDIGTALSIALRFIPVVSEEFLRIQLAQRARGARFDDGPLMARIRTYASVLTPLVVGLFRRSDRLARSMSARCYEEGAVHVPPRPLAPRDKFVLASGIIVCVLLVVFAR